MEAGEDAYVIRPHRFDEADHETVARLELDCTQGTDFKMIYAGDKPRASKFDLSNSVVLMADSRKDNRTVGCFMAHIRSVQFWRESGVKEKVSWVYGLRVNHEHRRTGLASLLIAKMESQLIQRGVTFVYCGIGLDNTPSAALFLKLRYSLMFTNSWLNLNVPHRLRQLSRFVDDSGVNVSKLTVPSCNYVLRQSYGSSFFFPDLDVSPLLADVYVAQDSNSNDQVEVVVSTVHEGFCVVEFPFYQRILIFFLKILNWIFPNFFEEPLPLGRPWYSNFLFPIHFDVVNPKNVSVLLKCALKAVLRDRIQDTSLVVLPPEQVLSSLKLDRSVMNQVLEAVGASSVYTGLGMQLYAKSLLEDDVKARKMINYAASQDFWFLDGNEL